MSEISKLKNLCDGWEGSPTMLRPVQVRGVLCVLKGWERDTDKQMLQNVQRPKQILAFYNTMSRNREKAIIFMRR